MKEGDVYFKTLRRKGVKRQIFRRIVGIHLGKVVYSRGTNKNGICKVESFEKWARNPSVSLEAR